ncbi:MAG: hypothetical protein C0478_13135 [Planctomyces sp.]|nr:hypothetical protein [Planctomyces sp.]
MNSGGQTGLRLQREGSGVISQELAMGVAVAAVGLYFTGRAPWIVAETRKGRWLKERLGEAHAIQFVRFVAITFTLLGLLLASGIIEPLRWE